MFAQKWMFSGVMMAALSGSAAFAHASETTAKAAVTAAADRCVFDEYAPEYVKAYWVDQNYAYGTFTSVRGAQIFVEAQPGLTPEWLTQVVERALQVQEANKTPSACGPNLSGVQVSVSSAGRGFWITLIGRDEKSANALVHWAQAMLGQHRHPQPSAAKSEP
jgi:hypothetical protein